MRVTKYLSSYLKSEELSRPVVVQIERVEERVVSGDDGEEQKLILHVRNGSKPVMLSRSAVRQLVELFGEETDAWLGRSCIIFNDKSVQFRGKLGGIRFRALDGAAPRAPAPARPAPPAAQPAPVQQHYAPPPAEGDVGAYPDETPF
jgi:hypothetical protein